MHIVGVDLGGTKIATALVTEKGEVEAFQSQPTLAEEGQERVIDRIEQTVRAAMAGAGLSTSDVAGIGIGAPGPCDYAAGVLTEPPNLPGWYNVPLKSIFENRLGIPTFVGNDANAAAQAEHRFGTGRGVRNMIYVTVSTGIGGGLILDGRLYAGSDGAAGEVGHMTVLEGGPRCNCGDIGCWEAVASGTALAREAAECLAAGVETSISQLARDKGGKVTAELVHQAALQGDRVAQELIANVAHYLGVGLVNLVHIFNPDLIVLGGGMMNMGEMLMGPACQVLEQRGLELPRRRVRLAISELGNRVGVLGAAAQVLEALDVPGLANDSTGLPRKLEQ